MITGNNDRGSRIWARYQLPAIATSIALAIGGGALAFASGGGATHHANAGNSQYNPKPSCDLDGGAADCPAGAVEGVSTSEGRDQSGSAASDDDVLTSTAGPLPFTGLDIAIVGLAGLVLLFLGVTQRRLAAASSRD